MDTHTQGKDKHPHKTHTQNNSQTHDLPEGVCASVLLRNLDRPVCYKSPRQEKEKEFSFVLFSLFFFKLNSQFPLAIKYFVKFLIDWNSSSLPSESTKSSQEKVKTFSVAFLQSGGGGGNKIFFK